jgi:hypothetical protein
LGQAVEASGEDGVENFIGQANLVLFGHGCVGFCLAKTRSNHPWPDLVTAPKKKAKTHSGCSYGSASLRLRNTRSASVRQNHFYRQIVALPKSSQTTPTWSPKIFAPVLPMQRGILTIRFW